MDKKTVFVSMDGVAGRTLSDLLGLMASDPDSLMSTTVEMLERLDESDDEDERDEAYERHDWPLLDVVEGIYWACYDGHTGIYSDGYRLLSLVGRIYSPGACDNGETVRAENEFYSIFLGAL